MAGYSQQVKLQFMADTSQPQKQLQQLATQLKQISDLQFESTGINKGVQEAVKSAETLQKVLQKAVNVDTGKLDMGAFTAELNKSGTTISQLSAGLLKLGPAGVQSFRNLASSVAAAEMPIRKLNGALQGMLTSLANTAKWQLSSSAIHAVMSGFSSMVGYVKDLNSSLNNIRIVTGQSVDDMARFAQEANKAAKALSTTTKHYADAALIYYQQGDSQEMAAKKAAITIKAANASFGTSAKEMSEYLTAVWNSYQVGANELERYVDIMAALGAKTATSLEEIATSMQKVAATANTVGVSMEQVSSIISTVSSVTRESAESIGTSYKTIFARIGDLKLGKTLEDGVGLGQVSSQLKKIGVNILDAQGNMRDMGKVIEELMGKWQQLSRAEQTATAQVVAGKRQYTQLMALMENSKMYQKNMGIATNAEGSLQTMADTYAESWSAAADRVRASWEGVWDSLLNDEAIISMMNGLAVFIQGIEDVIDGLGGLQGVLLNIGTVVTTIFQKNMTNGINQAIMSLKTFKDSFNGMSAGAVVRSFFTQTTSQRQQIQDTNTIISQSNAYMTNRLKFNPNYKSTMEARQLQLTNQLIAAKQKLQQVGNKMSVADQVNNQQAIEGLERQIQKVNQLQAETEEAKVSLGQTTVAATNASQMAGGSTTTARQTAAAWAQYNVGQMLFTDKDTQSQFGMATAYKQIETTAQGIGNAVGGARMAMEEFNAAIANGQDKITTADALVDSLGDSVQALLMLQSDGLIRGDQIQKDMQDIEFLMGKVKQAQANGNIDGKGGVKDWSTHLSRKLNATFSRAAINAGEAQKTLKSIGFSDADIAAIQRGAQIYVDANGRMVIAARQAEGASKRQSKQFQDTATQTASLGQKIAAVASSFMSAGSIMSSMSSLVQSEGESITSTVTSVISMISSAVMSATMAFQASNPLGWISLAVSAISAVAGYLIGEQEKTVQKTKEQAKTLKNVLNEKVDKHSEEISSMQTLLSQFNDLYAQKKAGANVDAELATAATELASAYNITGAAVANLTGDYENLIKKLQNLGSTDYQQINDSWMLGSMTNYANAAVQLEKDSFSHANNTITFSEETHKLLSKDATTEYTLSAQDVAKITALIESGYTAPLNSTWTNTEWYNKLAWAADTALFWWAEPDVGKYTFGEQMQTYDLGDVALSNKVKHKNGNQLDMTNAEVLSAYDQAKGTSVSNYFLDNNGNAQLTIGGNAQFAYHQYQELQDLLVYMEALGLDTTTGLGGQISAYLALVKTDMENYEQALEQFGKAVVTKESLRFTGKDAGVNYSFDAFTEDFNKSFDAYFALLQQQYGLTKTPEELKSMAYEAAMSGVNLNSSLDSYALALQAAYEITKDLAVAQTTISTIMAQYKIDPKYIDEAVIMAHYNDNEEYLEAIINSRQKTQAYDEAKNIQTKTTDAAKMLKEDMTFDEMEELYNQLEWGENGIIAWTDFYAMSYEDKRDYLEQLSDDYVQASIKAAEQAKIAAEAERDAANQAVTDHVRDAQASVTARMYNTVLMDRQRFAFDEDENELVIRPNAVTTREEREFLDAYNEFLNDPANADKNRDDFLKDYFLTMVEQDAIKDARYADFANAVELKADGSWGFKQDVQTTPEMSSTMLEWRAWSADPNNAGKTVADFVAEKQGEGMGGFSQDVIDEYNRLIAEAEAAGKKVTDAIRQEALWKAMGAQVDSVTTKIQKLSKALSQLPTNKEDLQFIAKTLFGGDMTRTMNSTAEERARAILGIIEAPKLAKSHVSHISGGTMQAIDAEGNIGGKPIKKSMTIQSSTPEDYAQYLEDWQNYDTLMSDALAVLNAGNISDIKNATSALSALGNEYENFVSTGKLSDTTKNALEMAGIDPNSITDIESYKAAMATLQQQQDSAVASMRTNLEKYGEGIIDWTKAGTDVTFDEFIEDQAARQGMSVEALLEQLPGLREAYEQWRQAAIQANDASVDLDAVDAQLRLSQAAAQSASELAKLKTAAEEAKTAVDQLNGALGKTEPLSTETSMRLEQLGLDISSWGDGTGEGALKAYGRVLGHSAMTQIEVLQHQKSKESDIAAVLGRWDAATELGDQRGWSTGLVKMGKDERSKLFDEMGLSAPVVTEIERMVEEAEKAGRELTWSDILQGLQDYDEDLTEQMDIIWAQFEDSGVKAVQAILQAEQTAAQQTVQIWKTACQAILAAKQGIAEGKSIGESLMGSDGQMAAIIAIALGQNKTPEQIKAMLSGGDSQAWQDVVNAGPNFNAATYATAQGGQTQFLYNSSGVMAGSASELYTNASDALGDHWENFLSQLTEAELASYNAAKAKAQTEGVKFDGKQWLLDYLFPGWKNTDGTFTSKATDDYNRSRGAVLEGEWTAEMKQARTELDAARTTFNRTYQEETANIKDWQAIHDAAVTSQQTGQSIYDILGKDQAAGIMARLGLTKEQLNAQTVETATAAINASVANINAAKVTFNTTTDGIKNIEMLGTAKDDAQEEVGEQVSTTTNTYGNATWVPVKPLKRNGPQAITADGEPAMTLNTTNGYDSVGASITSMAKAYNMSESAMKNYIRAVNNITDENTVLTQAHLDVATAAMRQQAGIDMAAESLDGYIRTIKKGDTDSVGYIKSLEGMRNIYKELYNLSDEEAALLSDDFLTNADNMALLQRAMAGDQTAWTQLQGNYNTAHATQIQAGTLKTQNGALVGDTGAGDDKAFTNQISKIQHEAQLLEQEMEALNSIDITEMPVKGTAAYEALSASLQKAGKSMLEYSRMSQKERAQALGDAKVAKLKEQKVKNAELIKAYEDQYNFENAGYGWDNAVAEGYTTQYQAYLDAKERELEINQEIADTQQSTEDQINKIGAADVEARIAALEAEKEQVQETIDAYAELADIMMQAAETGELTASQIQKIKAVDEGLLTQWNNATTYAQRVNIAAKAQATATQKSVTALTSESEGIAEASRQIYRAAFATEKGGLGFYEKFDATNLSDKNAFASSLSFLSAEAQKVMLEAYDKVSKRMTSESTVRDFIKGMQDELANMTDKSADEIAALQAELQTTIAQMYAELGEYEVQMAQQAVKTWLDAFNQIAAARKQLLMGEDIGDSLTSSLESYVTLAKAFKQGGGTGSLADAYRSGSLSASQLALDSAGDLTEMLFDSMGMSTDNKGFNLFTNVFGVDGKTITGKNFRDVNARATEFGMKREDFETQEAFEEAVNKRTEAYVQNLLQQSGYDETTARDLTNQALYGSGSSQQTAEAAIEAAALEMHGYAQEYAELLESNTQLAEVEATYQKKVQDLTEQRDKAKLGASATDAIQDTKESERTADTVAAALQQAGISPEAYMAMLREKGYDVKTLDDVAKLTDAQLEAIETSLEQDALAAGQKIVSAAQIFHAIVTSDGDEAALTAKLAALGVTRDANGNIQGFGQYKGAGLNYGENTAVGQQASDNVTEATEEQNTLKNKYGVNQTEDINTKITRAAELAGMSMEELREYADYLKELGEINGETEEQNLLLAASYARIQKGLKSVQDNLKTYTKTLKNAQRGTREHKNALDDMREMYADVLDLDDKGMKNLSEEFMTQEDVLKDLEDAAKGVDGAYDRLQEKATKHILDNLTGDADISSMTDEIATLATAVNQLPEGTVLDWNELLGQGSIGQAVASNLSSLASFVNGLASSASEASSIMQALAAALGMDMEIEQKDFDVTQYEWQASAGGAVGYGPDGSQVYVPLNVEAIPVEGTVTGWSIKTITNKGTYGGGVKGGSKGGGGGGNKKPKQAKKIKFEDEVDRYHEVNQRLERMGELLDKIDKYKARAFGKGYLKNLEQETKMLKAQQAMYKRKMEEAKLYYEQDSANMASKYGATFDEYGNMSNYDEVLAGIIADENSKIDYYNSLSAAEQEKLDEQYEHDGGYLAYIAKMREDFKKDLAKMEDSAATLGEATSAFEEVINQISANNLKAITYKAEYQIELNDADRKLLQFYVDRYEDDVNKQAESFEKLIAQGEKLASNTEALTQKQKDLETAYANGEITQADYAKGLQETRDALLENAQALLELEKNVKEFYGNTLEMISEAFHEQVDHITAATDAMQSYINILGLMGKGQNYSEKALFYGQRAEFAQQEAIAKKAHLDLLLGQKADFDALIASGKEMTEVEKQWYEDLLNAIDDANGEFLESVETALTYLQEKYQNAVAKISEDLDKALGGSFGSLEGLSDAYSYYTEVQGRYVSAARELYEVSKLNRDIEMSIEDATTSASKKMLKDLQDRINKQSELNQLTEYDIEMNRLQYELALAKIGLEEAQNAKDTVRLTRDESGNYIYQYTADNDKINEAQQTYEDVLQQINDLALNRVQELEQGFIETRQRYKEQYDAIVNDMNLTDEERAIKLAELNERFKADMEYYAKQMEIATGNLTTSNSTIMQVYSDDLRTVSMTTRDGINEDIAALIANKDEAIASFQQAVTDATTLSSEHQKAIDAFTSQTVGDYTAMSNAATKYGDDVDKAMQKAQEAVDQSTEDMLNKIRDLGADWESFINGPLDDFIDGIIDLAEEIQNTLDWLAQLETETATTPEPGPEPPANIDPTPQEPEGDEEGKDDKAPGSGGTPKKWKVTGTYSVYTPNGFFIYQSSDSAISEDKDRAIAAAQNKIKTRGGPNLIYKDWTVKEAYQFKTGGLADYTGPAWLDGTKSHPELVLNANDTQNMLQTVHSLRELDTESITMLLSALGMATASLFGALNGNYHASGISGSNVQELNQNVEIHADFPNVTDKNEIVEAIDDLVNRASQFAQKKIW